MNKAGNNRVSLELLGAAAFIVIADVRVIDPLLHAIADDFKIPVGSAGVIVSAYTIPYGLFQLFYGPLGDRIGKVRVIAFALTAFAVGTAACALVPNIILLTLLRFLTGVFAAGIIPISLAYIGDNFPYEQRQAAIGKYISSLVLGQILGGSLGGIFGQYISWRDVFILFGVIALIIAVILWRKINDLPPEHIAQINTEGWFNLDPYQQILTQHRARIVILGVFIEGFCLFGGIPYLGAFLRDRYHLPYIQVGFMLVSFGLGGLIYSFSVKSLLQRWRENSFLLVGGSFMSIAFLAIALFPTWILFIPFNILMGLGFYMMHGTLQTRATELTPESRGIAVSLFAFSLFIGQGIGAAVFGKVVDNSGYISCFMIISLGISLLTIWLIQQKT